MSHRASVRRMSAAALATVVVSLGATPALAIQVGGYAGAVLDPDPASGVVATAIQFASGSVDDPRGSEGTATLLARVLEAQIGAAVRSAGAGVQVDTGPDHTVVTMVAPSARWTEAAGLLMDALYDEPLDPGEVERAREDLLSILVFESGAPIREFEVELARFLYGEFDDHARRSLGTPETVGGLSVGGLESFRSTNLRPANAVVAVSGPVDRRTTEGALGTGFAILSEPAPAPRPARGGAGASAPPRLELHRTGSPPLEIPSASGATWAWDSAAREVVDRDITSTRISVATPLPVGAPSILAEFLTHLVLEDLTPSPPDPGLYDANVEIVEIDGAPVLVATAAVDPQATERWGDRLFSVIERMASQPPEGAFFELARRRFRSRLVLELAVPENRARWLAGHAASGQDLDPSPERGVWSVTREGISALAAASGPSRILMFGPSRMMPQD